MKPAKSQIDLFKTTGKDHIHTLEGFHRTIGYADVGNPEHRPVMFVHGSPGSKDGWYAFLMNEKLIKQFQLITVDRPGYGMSAPGVTESSLQKQAEDLWSVLKINKSGKKPILVGHSFGGPVIAKMAMLHPDEVSALIFVASSVDPKLEETKFIQKLGGLWGIRSLIPEPLRVCNEEILTLKKELEELLPHWSEIKANIFIVHGDKDPLVPVENVDFLKKMTHPHSVNILVGVNHFIPWQHPEAIEEAIISAGAL